MFKLVTEEKVIKWEIYCSYNTLTSGCKMIHAWLEGSMWQNVTIAMHMDKDLIGTHWELIWILIPLLFCWIEPKQSPSKWQTCLLWIIHSALVKLADEIWESVKTSWKKESLAYLFHIYYIFRYIKIIIIFIIIYLMRRDKLKWGHRNLFMMGPVMTLTVICQ